MQTVITSLAASAERLSIAKNASGRSRCCGAAPGTSSQFVGAGRHFSVATGTPCALLMTPPESDAKRMAT